MRIFTLSSPLCATIHFFEWAHLTDEEIAKGHWMQSVLLDWFRARRLPIAMNSKDCNEIYQNDQKRFLQMPFVFGRMPVLLYADIERDTNDKSNLGGDCGHILTTARKLFPEALCFQATLRGHKLYPSDFSRIEFIKEVAPIPWEEKNAVPPPPAITTANPTNPLAVVAPPAAPKKPPPRVDLITQFAQTILFGLHPGND